MNFSVDYNEVKKSYHKLSEEQKNRFFQGGEKQAERAISSLAYLLGCSISYDKLLELYITIAVRIMLFNHDNDRVNMTVQMRFSDIVPKSKSDMVISCCRRIVQNFGYLLNVNNEEALAYDKIFEATNQDNYAENEKNWNDAVDYSGFGTDPDNPIYAHMAAGSYEYLNLLYTPEMVPLTWERNGTVSSQFSSDPIDMYNLFLPDGKMYLTVYINMYSRRNSIYCPEGLGSFDLEELPDTKSAATEENEDIKNSTFFSDESDDNESEEYLAFLRKYSQDAGSQNNEPTGKKEKNKGVGKSDKCSESVKSDEMLSENTDMVLQGDLPVVLEKYAVYKKENGEVYAICSFIPITDVSIVAMSTDLLCFDIWHEKTQPVKGFEFVDLNTERDVPFGSEVIIDLPDTGVRSIDIVVRRIMLADGTKLQKTEDIIEIPELVPLEKTLNDAELLDEYKSQTYSNARYSPVMIGSFWRCTCGAINRNGETACHSCGSIKSVLFEKLDESALRSSVEEKKRIKKEKEEQDRIAAEEARKKAEEEAKARAEKKRLHRKKIAIGSAITALIVLVIYLIGWQIIPSNKYKKADALLLSGNRDAAYDAFADLGEFRDSSERAASIKYEDASKALEAGEYDNAYETFSSISDYGDSADMAKESLYLKAESLMEAGSFSAAADSFEKISKYKNSEILAKECRNEQAYIDANTLLAECSYKKAGELFETIYTYRDSTSLMKQSYYCYAKELIENEELHEAYLLLSTKVNYDLDPFEDSMELANSSEYQYAADCFEKKDYEGATYSFENVKGYKDSEVLLQKAKYQYGLILLNNEEYNDSERVFSELGNYKDSVKLKNESIYQRGISYLSQNKYDEAAVAFGKIKKYRDSEKQMKEAKYQKALNFVDQKEYITAEKVFKELGNYRDSAKLLKETKYQRATDLLGEKEYKQAVAVFKELGNYSDSSAQSKAAMYAYVMENKNNDNYTTYEYLLELKKSNYENSKSIYEGLYTWRITGFVNTSTSDTTTKLTSITSYTENVTFHYKLTGGAPGEKITLYHVVKWPDGQSSKQSYTWDDKMDGSTFSSHWEGYYWNDPAREGRAGVLTSKVYDKATGKLIGTVSIKVLY